MEWRALQAEGSPCTKVWRDGSLCAIRQSPARMPALRFPSEGGRRLEKGEELHRKT